ncbi:MAG: HWE histidine kinase domain-containing protein [Pseudomonadota bacterium]
MAHGGDNRPLADLDHGAASSPPSAHYLEAELLELLQDSQTIKFLDTTVIDGLWYWDLEDPEHEWMSPGFWRALGYDPNVRAHKASEWQDLIFPEDRETALKNFRAHLADPNQPYDQIVRYVGGHGGTVTVRCRGMAVRREGVPVRLFGTHTVVSDSRSDDLTSKLNELLEFSSDAVIAWTTDGGIKRWNRGAQLLYGYTPTEAIGQPIDRLLRPAADSHWDSVYAAVMAGTPWSGEMTWRSRTNDSVITSTRMQRVAVTGGSTLILQTDRDIRQVRKVLERNELLVRELHHRVRNLFSVVDSLVSLSARFDSDCGDFAQKLSGRVRSLSQAHAAGLAEDNEPGADLKTLASSILMPYALNPHRLTLDGPDLFMEQAALTPLALIFNELATNAIKYGAWSALDETVTVRWSIHGDDICLVWAEPYHRPTQPNAAALGSGFGTKLIEMTASQLHGTFKRIIDDGVLRVEIAFPRSAATVTG